MQPKGEQPENFSFLIISPNELKVKVESFIWRECQTVHLSFSLGSTAASHPPGPHSPTGPRKSSSFCTYQSDSARAYCGSILVQLYQQTRVTLPEQKKTLIEIFQHKGCSFVMQPQPHKSPLPAPDWKLAWVVFTAALPPCDPHRPFAWTALLSRGSRATHRRGREHMCGRNLTAAVTFA